jgi:uncharacterized DUF497 family protein
MTFEWDERKREENIRKHGIDFADVTEVFTHPMLTALDLRRDYGEDRWIGLGLMKEIVVVVVFVEHEDENHIRIISAQKATRYESRQYAKYLADRLGTTEEDAGSRH